MNYIIDGPGSKLDEYDLDPRLDVPVTGIIGPDCPLGFDDDLLYAIQAVADHRKAIPFTELRDKVRKYLADQGQDPGLADRMRPSWFTPPGA